MSNSTPRQREVLKELKYGAYIWVDYNTYNTWWAWLIFTDGSKMRLHKSTFNALRKHNLIADNGYALKDNGMAYYPTSKGRKAMEKN